ncbi:hypothetical protein Q5752_002507 [Cryptotrichosporon argae]
MFPADIPTVSVSGTPYEIGQQHGRAAPAQIRSVLASYRDYFATVGGVDWAGVLDCARQFAASIERAHIDLYDEMRGIADGAGEELLDIIALNARSEIALTSRQPLPVDGCSSLSWRGADGTQWLGQNWDWKEWAQPNMIVLDVAADAARGTPRIKFVTEAGMIGKIGLNEHGVTILINALRGSYISYTDLPVHLIFRRLLEQPSLSAARDYLSTTLGGRAASAAHVLVGDATGALSVELSPLGNAVQEPDAAGWLLHTNHILWKADATEELLWADSVPRLAALRRQADKAQAGPPGYTAIRTILSDRSDGKTSVCRFESSIGITTVFSIAVDCAAARAEVKLGRPDEDGALVVLDF